LTGLHVDRREVSQASWLVAGIVPGIERQPLKKLPADEQVLLQLLRRWQNKSVQAGHAAKGIVVAYEAGRDGFWLARLLRDSTRPSSDSGVHPALEPAQICYSAPHGEGSRHE
jgi:hypothetical protein